MVGSLEHLGDEELGCWLAAAELARTSSRRQIIRVLFDRMGSLSSAWQASADELAASTQLKAEIIIAFLEKRRQVDPGKIRESVRLSGLDALSYADMAYPACLKHINDPPLVLFVKGQLQEEDFHHAVGVVGTRRPTAYGQRLAKDIASGLSENGVTVVSGLAFGVDSLAHWGALSGGSRTIAVVGSGADLCYPASNRRLYEAILADNRGAVVSEYFPGTRPEKWHFPERNRIIAGLSQAVVVVEAGEFSGALITARLAFEQNREVFAVPGRVDSPLSRGTNNLIQRNMAHLTNDHKDVLDVLQWVPVDTGKPGAAVVELYGREKEIFDMLGLEPIHFDSLCESSGMSAGEMSATVTMLELAGLIESHQGDWYSRKQAGRSKVPQP